MIGGTPWSCAGCSGSGARARGDSIRRSDLGAKVVCGAREREALGAAGLRE